MDDSLDLVLAQSSPLRDRSNEAHQVEAYKTPKKRRSLGGEDVGRRRRPSYGSPESDPRPVAEAGMMSFDEMRKQLSLWQSHLSELTAEHREAEKLRQDTSSLRSKLVNSEAEASERARRLVETRVQVQQKTQELATTQEQLNKKFIELAQEKEASQQLRWQICQLRDESEEQLKQKCKELLKEQEASEKLREELQVSNDSGKNAAQLRASVEAELSIAKEHLAANEAEAARLEKQNVELKEVVKRLELQLSETEARDEQKCCEAIELQQKLEGELQTVRGSLEEERKLSAIQQEKLCKLSDEASASHLQLQDLELELAQMKDAYATFETQHHVETQQLQIQMEEVRKRAEEAEKEGEVVARNFELQSGEVQRLLTAEAALKAALDGHSKQLTASLQEQQQVQRQLSALQKVHADSLEGQRDREVWKIQAETEEAHAAALKLEVEEATLALEAAQQEATLWKQRAEVMLGRRKAVMQVAARWQGSDAAWDWLMEQGQGPQELQDLPEGSELRLQNRELCLSLRQFKQDCELLESENLSLKEALACMEDDLHRVSDQHAQLVGHVNHRQKIRYTMKLKEEINRLCSELKKARQRIVQLEVSKESESLFEALASLVGSPLPTRTKRPGSRGSFVLPRRASAGSGMKMKVGNKGDDADLRLAEAEQLCMLQQSALDRISMDFQHLKALIERAVMLADTERRNGVAGGNFAALLHRLREIIAANHRTPCAMTGELGPLPVAATSITCDDDDVELAEGDVICYGQQEVSELS